ncbi:MAG: DHH family phosphoesterase [bacterium]|nr:DHH family phosphoesterase [bacterium]
MEIKNLKKAAQRLQKAVKDKERVILYGDADLDGITSALILQEALKNLGGQVAACYFPDREKEGYGITLAALEKLKPLSPALLVSMDLGIGNVEEVPLAHKAGFEVLIIDHHEVIKGLPKPALVVDPKQEGDTYPFKEFATCGLCFRLAELLLGSQMTDSVKKSLVELAGLGTIADMMPRKEDNILIVEEGYEALFESWRPGIRTFFDMQPFGKTESRSQLIDQMISVLNARDAKDGMPAAWRLLTVSSTEEARVMIEEFIEKNRVRKEKTRSIVEETRKRMVSKDPIIFEGDTFFEYELLGSASSILAREYDKPVFLYKDLGDMSLGSVRTPDGYNSVEAMKASDHLLHTYGGHPHASGFRIENSKRNQFRDNLREYFKNHERTS